MPLNPLTSPDFSQDNVTPVPEGAQGAGRQLQGVEWAKGNWKILVVAGFLSAALVCMIWTWGHQQFGGHDHGVLVDVSYRMLLGQRPYHDFYPTVPVLFYLGGAWAYALFGLSWSAFPGMAALLSLCTFWLQLGLLRRLDLSWRVCFLVAFAAQMAGVVTLSYWWYNSLSSMLGATLVLGGVVVQRRPNEWKNWGILVILTALVTLSKPNIGFLIGGFVWLPLLILSATRRNAIIGLMGSLGFAWGVLALNQIAPSEVLASYLSVSGRGKPSWERYAQDQSTVMVLVSTFALWFVLSPIFSWFQAVVRPDSGVRRALPWTQTFTLLGAVATALYACTTNGELKFTDMPPLIIASALLCYLPFPTKVREQNQSESITRERFWGEEARKKLVWALVMLCIVSFYVGQKRWRVLTIGRGIYYENVPLQPLGENHPFFARLQTGPAFRMTLDEMQGALSRFQAHYGRLPRLFCGVRLEYGYAAFNLQPPLHTPTIWDLGVGVSQSEMPEMMQNFLDNDYEICLFRDFYTVPTALKNYLGRNYDIYRGRAFFVFVRKGHNAFLLDKTRAQPMKFGKPGPMGVYW